MAFSRRKFMRKLSGLAGTATLGSLMTPALIKRLEDTFDRFDHLSADEIATNEDFWSIIQQAYTVSPTIVNLNNGGVCPQPKIVQDAVEHYNRYSNEMPSYYMWRRLDLGKESLRGKLASLAGCSEEEIAINRNASEALETIIFGLRLKAGDEVVLTKQDYPSMINAWKQREHRDGIVLKWLNFEYPSEDKQMMIDTFVNAFTSKTKVVHITHVVNWIGQIVPVKEIADAAKARGIEVVVDAAHSFAQFDYKFSDLNCDYLGTSLHKWLCAPFGSGMLYVRKGKIKNLYPLFAAPDPEKDDIRKFENLGTRSLAIEQAIGQAINFHLMIGVERKQKRLQYLKEYWITRLREIPGVQIHSSLDPQFGCALALFSIDGFESLKVTNYLMRKQSIHTVAINWENIHGVRITPNVYTMTYELDRFVEAVKRFIEKEKLETPEE